MFGHRSDTLSRVIDSHDRDSMIYADGAGATVLEKVQSEKVGFLSHSTLTLPLKTRLIFFIFYGESYNKSIDNGYKYIKCKEENI